MILLKRKESLILKILKNKIIIQSFLWEINVNKINKNNPYEVAKFEKQMRKLCSTIKDSTLRKYILEDFLNKVNKLTPNVINKSFSPFKRSNVKILNETKRIHFKKKDLTRDNLLEFSILFLLIFYSGAIKDEIDKVLKISFTNDENRNLRDDLVNLLKENKSEKEIEKAAYGINPDLVKTIEDNSNLKIILNKKNYDQIKNIFYELLNDLSEADHQKKDRIFEKKLINNPEEKVFNELVRLKSQINRD